MIFLLLGEGVNDDISESVAKEEKAEKNLVFTKTNTKLSLSLYYTGGKSYLYVLSLYYICDESYLYVNKKRFTNSRPMITYLGMSFL